MNGQGMPGALDQGVNGQMVGQLCALAGLPPDIGQQAMLDDVFHRGDDGKLFFPSYEIAGYNDHTVTDALVRCALGWLYLTSEQRILWTTHDHPTARIAFERLIRAVTTSAFLARRVDRIGNAHGGQEITMVAGGPRLLIRTRRQLRGDLPAGRLIIQQAEHLTEQHKNALLVVAAGHTDPQLIKAACAGQPITGTHPQTVEES
jgi:hypothetical protein